MRACGAVTCSAHAALMLPPGALLHGAHLDATALHIEAVAVEGGCGDGVGHAVPGVGGGDLGPAAVGDCGHRERQGSARGCNSWDSGKTATTTSRMRLLRTECMLPCIARACTCLWRIRGWVSPLTGVELDLRQVLGALVCQWLGAGGGDGEHVGVAAHSGGSHPQAVRVEVGPAAAADWEAQWQAHRSQLHALNTPRVRLCAVVAQLASRGSACMTDTPRQPRTHQ